MLSSVPLPRLLEGVAASLREHVAPHVDDRFATMQLRAIDELLRNLALRTDWRLDDVAADVAELDALLAVLASAGALTDGQAADPPPGTVEEALTRRIAELGEARDGLARLTRQDADRPEVAAARDAVAGGLRAANERERALLQTGMYG